MICRHFGACGGCSVPGVPYDEQLAGKQARLRRLFPAGALAPITPSPDTAGFRHKVAFVFDPPSSGSRIRMGHFRARSGQVLPVDECPVHSDRGNRLAFALRDHLARGRVPPGVLRHVLIRSSASRDEASLMLVVTENHPSLRAPLRALLGGERPPDGCFVNIHDQPGPYMVGARTIRIAGRERIREDVLGTAFLISPTAFFQTNVGAAGRLLEMVLEACGGATRVLDLYCGSGFFALPLARQGRRVVAVEENRQAIADADANLRLNRVPAGRVRLIAARVEDAVDRLAREDVDLVVLDPPRQGCPDRVIDAICAHRPARIVYVSCNVDRLAAERSRFLAGGYALARVQPLDMFPHTDHIEAVAVFEPTRSSPSGPRA